MTLRQDLISGFQPDTMEKKLDEKVLKYIRKAGEKGISQKVLLNRMRGYKIWKEIAEATASLVETGRVTARPVERERVKGSDYVFFFVK